MRNYSVFYSLYQERLSWHMNHLQIENFITVVETGGITKAAEKLFVTQPAVSKQLHQLEQELGVRLFKKSGRTLELTDFGREFYELSTSFKENLNSLVETYKSHEPILQGSLRIAYNSTWLFVQQSAAIIEYFKKNYPKIDISFYPDTFSDLFNELKWEKYDAALWIDPTFIDVPGLCRTHVTDIPTLILYSDNYPIEIAPDSSPEIFSSARFFSVFEGDSSLIKMENAMRYFCLQYGFSPIIERESSWQNCLSRVYSGDGVIITDGWAAHSELKSFNTLELDTPHEIALFSRKTDHNPCLEVLKKELPTIL